MTRIDGAPVLVTTDHPAISLLAVPGIPAIRPGDDLARILGDALEAAALLPRRGDVLVVTHKIVSKAEGRYVVLANAGVDQSNVPHGENGPRALLLPEDPDASSAALRAALEERFRAPLAVVVSDSVGRAWRNGVVGLALGAAGLPALLDLRGRRDLEGRPLKVTQVGLADEIASAAQLLMGEADEGRPAVLMRGLACDGPALPAAALVRDRELDLFR